MLAASKDNSFIRYWFVTVDENVPKIYDTSLDFVVDTIENVLDDPLGWNQFGYFFERISAKEGLKLRGNEDNWKYVLHLSLCTSKTVLKNCGFEGLSCADLKINRIYFNLTNWLHGTVQSGFNNVHLYRMYLVSHEVGHLLGRRHSTWEENPNKKCGIMSQQSIKPNNVHCIANVYPIESDFNV